MAKNRKIKIKPLRALLKLVPMAEPLRDLFDEETLQQAEQSAMDAVRRAAVRELTGPAKREWATQVLIENLDRLVAGGPGPVGIAIELGSDAIIRAWAPVIVQWAYDEIADELDAPEHVVRAPKGSRTR